MVAVLGIISAPDVSMSICGNAPDSRVPPFPSVPQTSICFCKATFPTVRKRPPDLGFPGSASYTLPANIFFYFWQGSCL